MTSPTAPLLPAKACRPAGRAFTLVELILVMALLAIAASLAAPKMASFFRGRALDEEARRLLAHYGQSRAVAEGVPVLLWINPSQSIYGLSAQTGFVDTDTRATTYNVDPTLTIEATEVDASVVSENGDERLGLPQGVSIIRFNPDGFFDEISVQRIVIRQGNEGAIEIVPSANRLSYEMHPVHDLTSP
jgi:prepilin-type N-terminal cleavage/methylation domain-containing protein